MHVAMTKWCEQQRNLLFARAATFQKKNINKSVIYFTILTDRSLSRIFYIKEASAPENCADKMCF